MTDCESASSPVRTGRCSVETMPSVTVLDSPSGAPTASTDCPTRSASLSAKVAATRPSVRATFTTARSLVGSVPTTVAGSAVPSARTTSTPPPAGPADEVGRARQRAAKDYASALCDGVTDGVCEGVVPSSAPSSPSWRW